MESKETRKASHAGSWYTGDAKKLDTSLADWLKDAKFELTNLSYTKAVIGPHAGYRFSGPTQAWAYKYLNYTQKDIVRVFLLGPSHKCYFDKCALSSLKSYETPIGDIELDHDTINKLKKEGEWVYTDQKIEENEHSLEMHLPYIRKLFEGKKIKLVPIMVGAIDAKQQAYYGKILAKYFDDEQTIFCISSDFCHWGSRFNFNYYNDEDGEIYESIEKLDRMGMEHIENKDFDGFTDYLNETKNTICGRRPIGVLLNIIENSSLPGALKVRFVQYAQSSQVIDPSDSSVSYASGVVYV